MLGLVLVYFIGKQYYELAIENNQRKWLFAILGIAMYYIGAFLFGIIFAIVSEMNGWASVDTYSDIQLGLFSMPFGLLSCYLFYILLKKQWSKKKIVESEDLLDGGLSA